MGHVEDRWYKTVTDNDGRRQIVPTTLCGKGMRYRARYLDPSGKERSRSFPDKQKRKAETWLTDIESDKHRGTYIDPDGGKTLFGEYAIRWLDSQTFDAATRETTERRLRLHVLPTFDRLALNRIRPTTIRAWDRSLQADGISDTYRRGLFDLVLAVLGAAVDDELIRKNPCQARTIRRARVTTRQVLPWRKENVIAVRANLRERYRVTVDLAAGLGMRQGEVFALAVEDLDDNDEQTVHVQRQIKIIRNRLVFALPKGRKTREVPLPGSVTAGLKAHMRQHPPVPVTLPWQEPDGDPATANLVLYTSAGSAINRKWWNTDVWHPALRSAGIEVNRDNGLHALRHFYASALLDAGESIKALSEYLGHHDPGFTLRTYTHLMPDSRTRTRRAIDDILGHQVVSDGLGTA